MKLTMDRFGLNHNLSVMCGTIFSNVFFNYTWYPLLPLYYRQLGANDWEIGLAFTSTTMARMIFAMVGGALADRYGRRKLLVLPALAAVPLYLVAAGAGSWSTLLAMLTIVNALMALTGPAFSALIAESSSEDHLAHSYSLTEFAVLAGVIAGPIAGAALVGAVGIPALVTLNAVMLSAGTLARLGLRETRTRAPEKARTKLRAALDANVRWYMVLNILVMVAFSIPFGPYFAILARDAWHNSEAEINLLFAAGNTASMAGILLGRLSDRWGARRVFMLGMLGFGISVMAWGLAPAWRWGLVPLLIAFGLSEGAFIATQKVQVEITSRDTRSSVFGIIATVTGVFGGLGPSLGAWLIALGGNSMPFIAAGALGLLAIAAVIPIHNRLELASAAGQPAAAIQVE